MGTDHDVQSCVYFSRRYRRIGRRPPATAMGFLGLALILVLSSCGDAGGGRNADPSERKSRTMETVAANPQSYSKLPIVDTEVPSQIETAVFALG